MLPGWPEKAITNASSPTTSEVLASAVVGNCKKVLLEAQQELSQLAQNYKPMHPRMLALQSKMQAVKEQPSGRRSSRSTTD